MRWKEMISARSTSARRARLGELLQAAASPDAATPPSQRTTVQPWRRRRGMRAGCVILTSLGVAVHLALQELVLGEVAVGKVKLHLRGDHQRPWRCVSGRYEAAH
jgi:predicted anti-sigma-YlaC factor YlaD